MPLEVTGVQRLEVTDLSGERTVHEITLGVPGVVTEVIGPGLSGPVGATGPAGPVGPQGPSGELALAAHIVDETPHPAYDDGPSLVLLFENGLL